MIKTGILSIWMIKILRCSGWLGKRMFWELICLKIILYRRRWGKGWREERMWVFLWCMIFRNWMVSMFLRRRGGWIYWQRWRRCMMHKIIWSIICWSVWTGRKPRRRITRFRSSRIFSRWWGIMLKSGTRILTPWLVTGTVWIVGIRMWEKKSGRLYRRLSVYTRIFTRRIGLWCLPFCQM